MDEFFSKGTLEPFVDEFGFEDLEESEQFERLCSFAMLNKELEYSLTAEELDLLSVGKNKGIDTIAIIVNGTLISSNDQMKDILGHVKGNLNARFFLVQAKTSAGFDCTEIGNFGDTMLDFFNEKPGFVLTKSASRYHEIYRTIVDRMTAFSEITLDAYFCSLGTWSNDKTCTKTFEIKKDALFHLGFFNEVRFTPIDKIGIKQQYKKATARLKTTFEFQNRIPLREIPNVEEAYLGYLKFASLKKIIADPDNGNLKSLYYDNVRDFLGFDNEINKSIKDTLVQGKYPLFSLLNNGITIIAEKSSLRQDQFTIENYQIVNGCQTTNVLFECRDLQGVEETIVPVKLIVTEDTDLRDSIIFSTNSQTKIGKEGLLAITSYQKKLEDYYKAAGDGLYYERRSNQYSLNKDIKLKVVVGIREQVKAFVAMYLDEPDVASGYFSKALEIAKEKLFTDKHLVEAYYAAGLLQYRFKEFISNKEIERKYNKARYHIYMLFRMIAEDTPFKYKMLSHIKSTGYFRNVVDKARNKDDCLTTFRQAIEVIGLTSINIDNQKDMYLKTTTQELIRACKKWKDA